MESSASDAAAHGSLSDLLFRWRGWLVIALGALTIALFAAFAGGVAPRARDVWIALPIVGGGMACRVWARAYFTRGSDTRRIQAHRLVVCGPYRHVRNPLYLGNMLVAGGLALAFVGLWPAVTLLLALLALYSGVIRSEEGVLQATWGAGYDEFRRKVPRWLPRIVPLPADPDAPGAEMAHALRKESRRIGGALLGWGVALLLALPGVVD